MHRASTHALAGALLASSAIACTPAATRSTAAPPKPPKVEVAARPPLCAAPVGVQPGKSFALPHPFDRFTAAGKLRLVERADANAGHRVRQIVIADASTGAVASTRAALPHAVWLSTDGSIQLVWEPGALVRVDFTTDPLGRRTRVAEASKDSDAEYLPEGGSQDTVGLSDDGRYYVHELEIRDIDAGTIAYTLPPVSAGGPNQRAWFVSDSGYVDACMRGCQLFDPRGKSRDLAGAPSITVGSRFDLAPAAAAVLVMPRLPFAQDWDGSFRVCSFSTGERRRCRPPFTLSIPEGAPGAATHDEGRRDYDAALCPTGDLAAVAWKGALRFFDTRTGSEVANAALPEAFAKGDAPSVRYAPASDAIALVQGDTMQWLEPTF
jgi:hypothetical protein